MNSQRRREHGDWHQVDLMAGAKSLLACLMAPVFPRLTFATSSVLSVDFLFFSVYVAAAVIRACVLQPVLSDHLSIPGERDLMGMQAVFVYLLPSSCSWSSRGVEPLLGHQWLAEHSSKVKMEQNDPEVVTLKKKMVETDACVGMTKNQMDNMGKKQ